jgi:hypothetical protein
MKSEFFDSTGHLKDWVTYLPAWDTEGYLRSKLPKTESQKILDHMKSCSKCQSLEIEAILNWANRNHIHSIKQISPSINSPASLYNTLEKYPRIIMEEILHYATGEQLQIKRNRKGWITSIIGTVKGAQVSEIEFNYRDFKTSVYCYKTSGKMNPDFAASLIHFGDFHIDFSNNARIEYSHDMATFDISQKEIDRNHKNSTINLSDKGKIIKIEIDGSICYSAAFDTSDNLTKESYDNYTVNYVYQKERLVTRNVFSGDVLKSSYVYEYDDTNKIPNIPTNVYLQEGINKVLFQSNSIAESLDIPFCYKLTSDNSTKCILDTKGNLIIKFHIPNYQEETNAKSTGHTLEDLFNKYTCIDIAAVDPSKKYFRMLCKRDGAIVVDQVAYYTNNILTKIVNNTYSVNDQTMPFHFMQLNWSNLPETNYQ